MYTNRIFKYYAKVCIFWKTEVKESGGEGFRVLVLLSLCFEAYLLHHWFYHHDENYPPATTGMTGAVITTNNLRLYHFFLNDFETKTHFL